MSYRIEYNPEKKKRYPLTTGFMPKWLIFAVIIMVALFAVQRLDTNKTIRTWLLPGDPEITDAALSSMVEDIREGESVKDAITTFCLEIIDHGQGE